MSGGKVITMNFKVSSPLKKIIEKHASSKNVSVSEYIRNAVLFDMVTSGNVDAFNYLSFCVVGDFFGVVRDALEKSSGIDKHG